MPRPTAAFLLRAGERIPLELTQMPGNFSDGHDHWSAGVRLERHDRFTVKDVHAGCVIHFENGFLVRSTNAGDVALFRSEPYA